MITSYHHVSLNGVKYRLAEAVEGRHYDHRREPLRLQTGAVVQGEAGKFQLRLDVMEWRLTDWSGGEGLLKFSNEESNRYWEGHNIDPFDEPGKLKLARGFEETKDVLGAPLTDSLQLAKGRQTLFGASPTTNLLQTWTAATNRWTTGATNSQPGFAAGKWHEKGIVGNQEFVFLKEEDVAAIWQWSGSGFTEWNTDFGSTTGDCSFAILNDHIYVVRPASNGLGGIYEIPVSGTPLVASTQVLSLDAVPANNGSLNILAAGSNRVYLAHRQHDRSTIWQITPSTAVATGFGEELLRQDGLAIDTIWYHMGVLFMAGRVGASGDDRKQVVMYLRGSEVGVLANLRDGTPAAGQICATESQEFDKAYFLAKYGPGDGTHEWTLFAVDLVSGAVAGTTVIDLQDGLNQPQTLVSHNGEQFFGTDDGDVATTYRRTIRVLNDGTFVDTSVVTARLDSAVHDFGLVDQKVLLSIRLMTEPLPTNSSVEIQYQLDQDETWTSAGIYSTDSGTGTTFTISTAASAKLFRNLQLRLILSNGGTVLDSPVVLSVSARATVAQGVEVFNLLLDLADDQGSSGGERKTGQEKTVNLTTAGDGDTVIEFLDGYPYPSVGGAGAGYDSYNVVLDDYEISLDRPGEGTAAVTLRVVD